MDTSTPLAKVKTACCSRFRRVTAATENDDEFAMNDSPINKVYDSVLEQSNIVLTQNCETGCYLSVSPTTSPSIKNQVVGKELLPFLDTPNHKSMLSILTNNPAPSEDVKELSEDYFIHDIDESIVAVESRQLLSNGNLTIEVASEVSASPLRKTPRKYFSKSCATNHEDAKLDFFNESMCEEFFADFELDNDTVEVSNNETKSSKMREEKLSSLGDACENRKVQEERLMESAKLDSETLELLFSEDDTVDWYSNTKNQASVSSTAANVNDRFSVGMKAKLENVTNGQHLFKESSTTGKGNIEKVRLAAKQFQDRRRNTSGRSIEVDDHVLGHIKNISEELTDDWFIEEKQLNSNEGEKHTKVLSSSFASFGKCSDFSTASGKAIKVDENLLLRGKKLFEDLSLDSFPQNNMGMQIDQEVNSEFLLSTSAVSEMEKCLGFSTASGKPIKVDEELLLRARNLLDDFPLECSPEKNIKRVDQEIKSEILSSAFLISVEEKCMGFNTASGKAIKVDQKSLLRAKKLLEDLPLDSFCDNIRMEVDQENESGLLSFKPVSDSEKCPDFSTASKSTVKIDEKMVIRRKKLPGKLKEKIKMQIEQKTDIVTPPSIGKLFSIDEIEKSCGIGEKTPTVLDDSLSNPEVLENFDPNVSSLGDIAQNEPVSASTIDNAQNEKDSAVTMTCFNDEDNQQVKQVQRSKTASPVFDSNKTRRCKTKKRGSYGALVFNPLNITYVRNDDSIVSAEDQFRTFNESFAQKSVKRKEGSPTIGYPTSKKSKAFDKNDIVAKHKEAAIEK